MSNFGGQHETTPEGYRWEDTQTAFLTTKEAARVLHVSEATVRRAVRRGVLPTRRLSTYGPLRIGRAAINELSFKPDREGFLRGDDE